MRPHEGVIDALHEEGQTLPIVPDHDLELGERVECPAQDQAHHGCRGLHPEAEGGAGEGQAVGAQLLDHRRDRMQVDDHPQLLGLGQDGPVAALVDVGVTEVGVGLPPLEAQLLHAALEFGGGGLRVLGRQRRETHEPVGIPVDRGRQLVVDAAGEGGADARVEVVDPGRGQRHDGRVDARFVHPFDATFTQIEKPVEKKIAVRLEGVFPVVHPAAAGGLVVHESRVARIGVGGVNPFLRHEMRLEIDGLQPVSLRR